MKPVIRIGNIQAAGLIWAAIPVLMMILFWFRLYYALPVVALGVYSVLREAKRICSDRNDEFLPLNGKLIAIVVMIGVWMVLVGIGGFVTQEQFDNANRNAVLEVLVSRPWPVTDSVYSPTSYLSYYFAFWLPAAAAGKIFSSYIVAQAALYVYCYAGLVLVTIMIISTCKERPLMVGALIFLFSGCDIFNYLIFRHLLCWHANPFVGTEIIGDPSVLYLCRFIYNQGIPAMVILMLMYTFRHRTGTQLLFFALLFTMGPFMALPLIPIVGYNLLRNYRKSITAGNIFGLLTCLLMAVFFAGNSAGTGGGFVTIFDVYHSPLKIICLYAGWFISGFGIFLPFIYDKVRHNALFLSLIISTIIVTIPVSAGGFDYGWKCTAPVCLYLMLLVIQKAATTDWRHTSVRNIMFAGVIILGISSNINIYYIIAKQHYRLLVYNIHDTTGRADGFVGKLFDRDFPYPFRDSYVTDHPTLYYNYFMPSGSKTTEEKE